VSTIYFDQNTPTNEDVRDIATPPDPTGANVPQTVTCLACRSQVWNLGDFRDAHAAWHDGTAATEVSAFGTATNPAAMPLSGTTDVVVPLSRTMPTATYGAAADIVSGVGTTLAGARVQGIVARTKTTVTVRVQNTGLAALAANAFTVSVLVRGPIAA
jgi:hypothetical protein